MNAKSIQEQSQVIRSEISKLYNSLTASTYTTRSGGTVTVEEIQKLLNKATEQISRLQVMMM